MSGQNNSKEASQLLHSVSPEVTGAVKKKKEVKPQWKASNGTERNG